VRFEPFAGLAYVNVHADGFSEQGGAAALTAQSGDTGVTFSTIGVRASDTMTVNGVDLTASGTLGWRHAWGDGTPMWAVAFSGGGAFGIAGVPVARNAAIVEADLSAAIADNVSLHASYTGQFGDGVTSQGVRGNLSIEF
jgi:outer membrane autotransporter protein